MKLIRKTFTGSQKGDSDQGGVSAGGVVAGTGLALGGSALLSTTKSGRLTGKVVRYHDTSTKNVNSILKDGIKSSYSTDPNNITNKVLKDIPMKDKTGLVYTAKNKKAAFSVGVQRSAINGEITSAQRASAIKAGTSPYHRVLKLELDYDDLKKRGKIDNPELLGKTNAKDWWNAKASKNNKFLSWDKLSAEQQKARTGDFKRLSDNTHVIKGDISSSNIVGGAGYKKRSLKQIGSYIKNNPGRFGKEAGKVGLGLAGLGIGVHEIMKNRNKQ